MESIYQFSDAELIGFTLVLLRVSALIVTMPVIGGGTIPAPVKLLFSLAIAFVLFPVIGWQKIGATIADFEIVNLAIKEVFVGIVFGFLARMFFMVLSMAGQIASVSMGISSVQLFDPTMEQSSSAYDQFFVILGTLFFLAINGHHIFIGGLAETYNLLPVHLSDLNFVAFSGVGTLVHELTAIGLKLSAPIMVSILFSNVALAVVGRAVPQVNILITSLPVNILVGLFVTISFLPVLFFEMSELMNLTAERVFQMLKEL